MLTLKRDAKRYCNFNWCVSRIKILSFESFGNGGSQPGTRIWVDRNGLKHKILLQERRGHKQTKKPPKVAGMPGQPPRLGRRRVPLCSVHQKASCFLIPRCKLKAFVGLCYYYLISFPCLPPLPSFPPSPRLALLHHVY